MGFFSSNKGGGTQVVHQEEGNHTKSRWFSSKPKHSIPPPSLPIKLPPPPPPQYKPLPTLSLKPASTPIHHSYQTRPSAPLVPSLPPPATRSNHPPPLLAQASSSKKPPSLFSERESAYQGSAFASGSKGGGGGLALGFADDQRSTTSRTRGKAREDVTTSTLASRLNELALANADGLLGDDGYRVLRQTMFEQVANGQTAPTESKYGQVPRVETHDERMGDRDNSRTPTPRHANGHTSSSRPSSTHSSSSSRSKLSTLGSFFRKKPSHHNLHDSQPRSSSSRRESSSLFSSNSSSAPGRGSISNGSLLQVPSDRNRDSRFGSTSTVNPSIKSGRTSRTALTDATFEGSRPSSLFSMNSKASTSAPPSAFHLRALHSTSGSLDAGGEALPGAEATPAEVRAEIASVEAEGRRLVAAFDGLEEAAFRDAEGGFGAGDAGRGGGGGDDWTVVSNPLPLSLHHKPQSTPLKPALKNPASASSAGRRTSIASSSFSTPSHSHSSSIASPSSFLLNSSTPSPPSTLSRKLSRINPSTSSTSNTSTNPSSFSPPTSTPGTSLLSRSTSSATTTRGSAGRASVDRAAPSALPRTTTAADDPEAAALEATVLDLRRRKKDTEERYARRLEFLKGKLRAAELKERAMR